MDDKAPGAFRTISEVADELDLPQHVLRFWESRFNDIKPMKRGGGRRYYRPDDIDLLRGIRHLLYGEGYTIRGVQRILREQGVSFVQSLWRDGAPGIAAADGEDELVDETLDAADEEDAEEFDEADEAQEPRGIRERLTSFIGRDLNERGDALHDREQPPMQDAPNLDQFLPRIEAGDRFGSAPQVATPLPAMRPQPTPAPVGLSTDQRGRLRQVLDELNECRALLGAEPSLPDSTRQ